MKAVFKRAVPYKKDALNLPVENVDEAVPYYEKKFALEVVTREDKPQKRAILKRDLIQIGLVENGGDPSQEGCFFEVDNVEVAFEELNGRQGEEKDFDFQTINGVRYKAFFVVAPDGLCYMISEPQV
ncbi:MAG: glyoxalase [Blastocatellia bacterium]|nr:MAG: glyoxalase [Blastocatellia bacterium]